MRQDICSSPLHYHHLDLLLLPYVPQLMLVTLCSATAGWRAAGVPGPWHPLEGKERVAQGSSRQILISQVSVLILSKLDSLCILRPLLHHIPQFQYPTFL